MNNTVYTYYDGIYEENGEALSDNAKIQHILLNKWKRSWAKQGWCPKVLTEHDAASHPFYEEFKQRYSRLPTANMPEYEMACYLRWLAVAAKGGGFMSDYDVINYSFKPVKPQDDLVIYESHPEREQVTPSVVGGTANGFNMAASIFAACEPDNVRMDEGDKPHTSDMIILQHFASRNFYTICPIVRQYRHDGWKDAPLVHYSHASTECLDRPLFASASRTI